MWPRTVKAVSIVCYCLITVTWIFGTQEIRFDATDFTNTGLWSYKGNYLSPYSILWYLFTKAETGYGLIPFLLVQWTIGFVGVTLLARRGWRNWLYGIVGGLVFFLWIDDLTFFVLSAYGKWYTSLAALVYKLPLGAPFYVWAYILHTSGGELFYQNIARYVLLGLLTVQPMVFDLKMRMANCQVLAQCPKCHANFYNLGVLKRGRQKLRIVINHWRKNRHYVNREQ